jgi:hypothetical protein
MNSNAETPHAQPSLRSLTLKQRIFVGALLLLWWLIVGYVDPSVAVTNHTSIETIGVLSERPATLA